MERRTSEMSYNLVGGFGESHDGVLQATGDEDEKNGEELVSLRRPRSRLAAVAHLVMWLLRTRSSEMQEKKRGIKLWGTSCSMWGEPLDTCKSRSPSLDLAAEWSEESLPSHLPTIQHHDCGSRLRIIESSTR